MRGTKGWDDAMIRARGQAEAYAKALPVEDGWPPFLIVVDVGHVFELFADFSRTGKHYTQFPDASSFRMPLNELRRPEVRDRLRAIWTEPLSLDPARRAARVTREIAARLAVLAKSLESMGHAPHSVATFLMRCLFTMFAEDVGLLPRKSFSDMLEGLRGHAGKFRPMAHALWEVMNTGGFSPILKEDLLRFNGGLFEDADALPLTEEQLALLIEAAKADWQDVEPAIFGTLLERALEPRERHKLGAHYTPRAYVERLVMPTIIEPLREEWENVTAAAVALANAGQADKAVAEVMAFHAAALFRSRARPGLRLGQLPLCHAGAYEAPRRRGARPDARAGRNPIHGIRSRNGSARRRPAPVSRDRDQSARGGDRRPGAVDRLPAMALPHARARPCRNSPY